MNQTEYRKKRIAILGSTGSIGTQALDVVRCNPDRFEIYALSANRSVDLLIKQAREFLPEVVCIADERCYERLKEALADMPIKVFVGADAIAQTVTLPSVDIVLASMVGYAGLYPTIEAIKHGKTIALANKETLVVAGELICRLAQQYHAPILPVDSEHSAIFQSLAGEGDNAIEKILLTASGGPFRTLSKEQLKDVTAVQALKHPNWDMGAKVTIDSATMMNKGFEVIEAKWLFGVPVDKIQVLVHPQSIVHSAVQFADGSIKAQLGMPDMRLPIQYALAYPERLQSNFPRVDFTQMNNLTFEAPDTERFRNLALAYQAIERGGNAPCVLNAANEVMVQAFLADKVGFLQMSDIIERVMEKVSFVKNPTYEDYVETDTIARRITADMLL
ncbi:MAG: 1-deoxy-D-xylulose-5-phosphate reductoisomerase [Paludibacter sp.]|nr:1-deoxy-D-xylulose-5-phosphate reductoisomerase [Bacteroidales bacterium]MCM1068981.1 1-deoxy-D-xylulose-5-phosphate reductoisomerase [Prevotella sp.]MCM1353644.1 1-deoxy-D-xylulose-5-phosphate reductoisomerase [Bacteroides sp.]MCM1442007.1 1-deoxy-D-xylulose-5-phosphate reductoisomerase [Muribaculum sp.]MCM1481537.1 1-deoxy-D-xylulose-5-phosphate reductoisomerase [Paludibacter sp.]